MAVIEIPALSGGIETVIMKALSKEDSAFKISPGRVHEFFCKFVSKFRWSEFFKLINLSVQFKELNIFWDFKFWSYISLSIFFSVLNDFELIIESQTLSRNIVNGRLSELNQFIFVRLQKGIGIAARFKEKLNGMNVVIAAKREKRIRGFRSGIIIIKKKD